MERKGMERTIRTTTTTSGDRASFLRGPGGTIELRISDGSSECSFSDLGDLLEAELLLRALPSPGVVAGRRFRALKRTGTHAASAPFLIELVDGLDDGPALLPDTLEPAAAMRLPKPDLRLVVVDVTDVWAEGIDLSGSKAIGVFLCDMADRDEGVVLHPVLGAELRPGKTAEDDSVGYEICRRIRFDDVDVRLEAPSIRFRPGRGSDPVMLHADLSATSILDSAKLPDSFLLDAARDRILGCADLGEVRDAIGVVAREGQFQGLGASEYSTVWHPGRPLATRLTESKPRSASTTSRRDPPEDFSPADVEIRVIRNDRFDVVWKDRSIGFVSVDRTLLENGGGISIHSSIKDDYTGRGVGSRVYDLVDRMLAPEGRRLSPSINMTHMAQIFWAKRDPEAFSGWLDDAIAARETAAVTRRENPPEPSILFPFG